MFQFPGSEEYLTQHVAARVTYIKVGFNDYIIKPGKATALSWIAPYEKLIPALI